MPLRLARKSALALVLAVVASLAGAQLVQAVVVEDTKDAPGSSFDIRRVSGVQSKVSDKISHQVRFYGSSANRLGTVCLGIYKNKTTANPRYTICTEYEGLTKPQQNDDQDPNVVRCPPLRNDDFDSPSVCKGANKGEADIKYGLTGFKVTLKPSQVGSPDEYYFAAKSRTFSEALPPPPGAFCCTDATGRKKLALSD